MDKCTPAQDVYGQIIEGFSCELPNTGLHLGWVVAAAVFLLILGFVMRSYLTT